MQKLLSRIGLLAIGVAFTTPALAQDTPPAVPRPTPIGNPGEWIPANSYPPAARASAEEGRVTFSLDVDETGRAAECKITVSSGSPLLDETTCNLMTANARFTPPRDKKNKPIASKWTSSVRWKLETPPPATLPVAGPPAPPAVVPTPAPTAAPKPAPKPAAKPRKK